MRTNAHHATCISGRDAVDQCSPDVEVLTGTAVRVSTTSIAQVCACLGVVLIEEDESHVLYRQRLVQLLTL